MAHPDEATVAPGAWVLIKLLDNDSFPAVDPDPRTLEIAEPPHHAASMTIVGRNVRYAAGDDEVVDTFTYRICDFEGHCVTAVVTVTVVDD